MKKFFQPMEHLHDDSCGCGHHHEHEKECGCGREHHHEHEKECECGHEHHHKHEKECECGHEHHHKHEKECECGHEHHHEHGEECACSHEHRHAHGEGHVHNQRPYEGDESIKHVFILENLGCANCAAKMERKISELPGVQDAVITYSTKQLWLYARDGAEMLPQIQDICSSIESGVRVVTRDMIASTVKKDKERQQMKEKEEKSGQRREIAGILAGAAFFAAGIVLENTGFREQAVLPVFVIAYLILGGKVMLEAVRNIGKGQIFDENFLMSLATIGAFVIREYPEAVGVMLFYRVGEFFEDLAVRKSRGQIMDAVDMRPEVVNLVQEEEIRIIGAEEAKIGDVLLVRPGDRIPLDGVVVEGESRIDTSPITGEPVPVKAETGDKVLSGCVNTSGQLKIRVEKPLSESMVTRILNSVENAAASKPQMERFITKFARVYTPVVIVLALGTAVLPSLVTGNWNYWIYTALSFLVMSCPCALVLSVPLSFFSGIGAGSKKGILFKGGVALEALNHVKAVVMDKTGTITKGNFVLQKIVSAGRMTEEELLKICASCEQNSTHPIGIGITAAAKEKGLELESPAELEEIAGHGIRAEILGSEVLCGNRKLMEKYKVSLKEYKNDAYGAEVLVAIDGKYAGYLLISDTIKEDAKSAVQRLNRQGIFSVMLTGDAQGSAQAVASEVGIDEVHAKLLPQDKLTELQKIRAEKGEVMFVGDGINDAPVLAGADVGAAMGSGADAAIEAADVVFMTSGMEAIPQSIAIAKYSCRISRQNVVVALAVKVLVMILGLCGFASMWAAVFADSGVAMICVLNSVRVLYKK
ncbi:heavy metal translocating P-type ATPase [Hominisplanchenecus murintestinalis]|uniref:heavy metal translocating P-type ATPase n=1 Tax=Hominisplanchenecus murintestinalis TaxID=2941517 RepID=UPI00204251B6|nr:heavy metal translocating P-type ATPase [Hominisplanchenecus murintestinalis]